MGKQSRTKKQKQTSQEEQQAPANSQLSPGKLILFTLIAAIGIMAILEGGLAFVGYKPFMASDPYVGFQSKIPLFVPTEAKDGTPILVTAQNKVNHFNIQSFPAKKPKDSYRIFTIGGSTTYGRPYFDSTSATGWLREFLKSADPTRKWEVINCGGVSYASYRAAALMEELVQYEPDLFIVYSGHNEFLERRTYSGIIEEPEAVTQAKLILGKLRTYSFLLDIKKNLFQSGEERVKPTAQLEAEVKTQLDNSVGPKAYKRDTGLQKQVLAHYRFNLNRMVQLAKSHNAGIVFSTIPVNYKDFTPFKSEHKKGFTTEEKKRYDEALAAVSGEIDEGRFQDAMEKLKTLLKKDGVYALAHFEMGRALFGLKKYEEAQAAFQKAVDEDICPLRAQGQMDEVIREVAAKNQVPLVDFTRTLKSVSKKEQGHGILGAEYFLDHVHPTIATNRLLGQQWLKTLSEMEIVSLPAGWGEEKIREITKLVESRIDEKTHAHAKKILDRVLIWAGKRKEASRFAKTAGSILGTDAESQFHMAFALEEEGKIKEAAEVYRKAIELNPDYLLAYNNLSLLLTKAGRRDEALELLEKGLKQFPNDPKMYNNYGMILYDEKRFEEAARNFEKSIDLDPGTAYVHANLGLCYSALSLYSMAIESYKISLKLDPYDMEARKYYGLTLAAVGKCGEAITHFEKVLDADPTNNQVSGFIQRCRQDLQRR